MKIKHLISVSAVVLSLGSSVAMAADQEFINYCVNDRYVFYKNPQHIKNITAIQAELNVLHAMPYEQENSTIAGTDKNGTPYATITKNEARKCCAEIKAKYPSDATACLPLIPVGTKS